MVARLRKKNTRQRGTNTHGWGSMKKHRGAGNRGGRGRAGTGGAGGSASGSKKPSVWKKHVGGKDPEKRGFTSRKNQATAINAGHLSSIIPRLVREGHAVDEKGTIAIDLKKIGVTKLLGAGKVTQKLNITVDVMTAAAQEKVSAAGGSVAGELAGSKDDSSEE
jgi:large subunit ribosomal protein L15